MMWFKVFCLAAYGNCQIPIGYGNINESDTRIIYVPLGFCENSPNLVTLLFYFFIRFVDSF